MMYLEKHGEGPRVFFGIHGWAGNHRTFRRALAHAPDDITFYTPDLPGYGDSPPLESWTLDSICDAIAECITSLGLVDFTLVGNCGGAVLGLEALRRPGMKCKRAVFLDAFANPPLFFKMFTWGEFGRRAYMSSLGSPTGRWIVNAALRHKRHSDTHLTRAFERVNHDINHRYICAMCDFGSIERYANPDLEVTLAYGDNTFRGVRAGIPAWKRAFPKHHIVEIPGAGHETIREAPQAMAKLLFGTEPVS